MTICAVKGCSNSTYKKGKKDYSLHRLPTEAIERRKWLDICCINENSSATDIRICSRHFKVEDFQVTQGTNRKIVKDGALPMLFVAGLLPEPNYFIKLPISSKSQKQEFYYTAQLPNGTVLRIEFDSENDHSPFPELITSSQPEKMHVDLLEGNCEREQHSSVLQKLKKKNKILKTIVKSCRTAKSNKLLKERKMKAAFATKTRLLREQMKSLQKQLQNSIKQTKSEIKLAKESATNLLSQVFTPAQVRMIKFKKKKAMWSEIDIARGIALRAKSNKAYNFVRDALKIPLPGVSTLQKHCQEICLKPGILHNVLNLMKQEFSSYKERDRQAILSFDEMAIDSSACYDFNEDKIYGQQKNLSLVVIRGVFKTWKQAVFYGYEQITVENIFDIIAACHASGITIKGLVCDLGGKNRGLWKQLGVSIHKTYILHPATFEKVWCFPDVPHLIKLLRNNLLDYGFTLSSGELITKADFEKLLRADSNEFKIQHKLSDYHLNLIGRERQRVIAACQLLSRRSSAAFRQVFQDKGGIADFIELVNDSFDILNARNYEEKNPLKSAYGLHIEAQNKVLDKMYSEMAKMRVTGKSFLYPFQKGYMISITSLKGFYSEMVTKYGIKYILPHRLNQDVLENAFSVIRSMGGTNVTPNAVDVKYRIRSLLLGWSFNNVKSASVTMENLTDPFVSYKLLSPLSDKTNISVSEVNSDVFDEIDVSDLTEVITGDNWKETIESMTRSQQCEFYGKEYIAGFLSSKFKNIIPGLPLSNASRNPTSFTQNVSRGHLTTPSYDFLNSFLEFENVFLYLFRDKGDMYGLFRGNNVMKLLCDELQKLYPDFPEKVIKLYVRTRVFVRIKYVNNQLKRKEQRRPKVNHFLRSRVPKLCAPLCDNEALEQWDDTGDNMDEMCEEWNEIFGTHV